LKKHKGTDVRSGNTASGKRGGFFQVLKASGKGRQARCPSQKKNRPIKKKNRRNSSREVAAQNVKKKGKKWGKLGLQRTHSDHLK